MRGKQILISTQNNNVIVDQAESRMVEFFGYKVPNIYNKQ